MSNTEPSNYVVFEWLVQPPPIITSRPCISTTEKLRLRFELHGLWNPEGPCEFLLFTVHFKSLGEFPPPPAIPLPRPYDSVRSNGYTLISYEEVHAGHGFVSFSDIMVGPVFPGPYQFQVVATKSGVHKLLPTRGCNLSFPIYFQSREVTEYLDEMFTNALYAMNLTLP